MANNRLYLVDTETKEGIMLAKGFGSGWTWRKDADELTEWLDGRDYECNYGSSDESKLILMTEMQIQGKEITIKYE